MPARLAKPDRSLTEEPKACAARLRPPDGGESIRAIAALETLSGRRVQHLIREQLDRRNASPADDFALLLNRIAPERLRLKAIFQRIGDEDRQDGGQARPP